MVLQRASPALLAENLRRDPAAGAAEGILPEGCECDGEFWGQHVKNVERANVVRSPTCCRVSEKAVTEHPPSELTSSIPPGADNVQHYIAAIKYLAAQYSQVNLCSETPHTWTS